MLRTLLLAAAIAPAALGQTVTIRVDAEADRHPISPDIYGVAYANAAELAELNAPLNRWGGNATSRYNWQLNATNHAKDWYFMSLPEQGATAGGAADDFIGATRAGGARPVMTIPMLGWAANLGPRREPLAAFSVSKYGPQRETNPYDSDVGNGVRISGDFVKNDPYDANVPVDAAFEQAWVRQMVTRWGTGGFYLLDNEPSLWHSTHRDVHPTGATMDEILAKTIDTAERIREADPKATIAGWEEWGWSGYFWSGYDQQWGAAHNWSSFPDRMAHDQSDYLPWLLRRMRDYEAEHRRRLIDIFTVHAYPQSGEFSSNTSSSMQRRRNRSTRALWDPSYRDESWIGEKVMLIPRMRAWVAQNYPGTRIGITEYSWGADDHINGATTQADVLGIFGREGLDVAAHWTTPARTTATFKAMRMYRNYDGNRSTFGDLSVRATAPNPDEVSAFAAIRTRDGALTVMLIAKTGAVTANLSLAGFRPGLKAERWQLTAKNVIERVEDLPANGGAMSLDLPAQSITLLVVPEGPRRRATR
jgi:hypothetical protein